MQTRALHKAVSLFALTAFGVLAIQHRSCAEGSTVDDGVNFGGGNHGVNRVIRTNTGYIGVEGTVDLKYWMPTNRFGGWENPVGTRDQGVMPFVNKPSAYLGGEFKSARNNGTTHAPVDTQIDAGLQLEPVTVVGVQNSTTANLAPGWSIFFYLDPVVAWDHAGNDINMRLEMSPRVVDPAAAADVRGMPYRGGLGAITGYMNMQGDASGVATFTFTPNAGTFGTMTATLPRVMLSPAQLQRWQVSAAHTVAPWADAGQPGLPVFSAAHYGDATVKRVSAMTRTAASELDGSWVRAAWSACQVRPNGANYRAWARGDVSDMTTGYDAARLGPFGFDKRHNGVSAPNVVGSRTLRGGAPVNTQVFLSDALSRPIVQFDANPAQNDAMMSPDHIAANDGRYATEEVIINLRTMARPIGAAVH